MLLFYCRSCRTVSAGRYCGFCRGSFQHRVCQEARCRQANRPSVRSCVGCGSDRLSDFAPSLNLAPAVKVAAAALTVAAACLLLRLAAGHAGLLLSWAWNAIAFLIRALFGVCPCAVLAWITRSVAIVTMLYALTYLLPGSVGKCVRSCAAWSAREALRVVPVVWRVFAGGATKPVKASEGKTEAN